MSRPALFRLHLAVLIVVGTATGATAFDRDVYGGGYGYAGRGFADEAIGGAYVGAPLTRFPRPSELVPPAWGYGTFGVPTVTGIRQAPIAAPALTVIDAAPSMPRRGRPGTRMSPPRSDARAADDIGAGVRGRGDVRVISVTVPRG